jgi:hypothetical protein
MTLGNKWALQQRTDGSGAAIQRAVFVAALVAHVVVIVWMLVV